MSITGRLVFEGSALARFGRRLRSGETAERGLTVSQLQALIDPLPARYVPNPRATERGVDIFGDPHREDDDGSSWARLTDARCVEDVVPGSAVVMGSSIGRYLAKVAAEPGRVTTTCQQ
jgi:hypothetical protein